MAAMDKKRPTILAVDDEPDILEAYRKILTRGTGAGSRPIALFDTPRSSQGAGREEPSFHLITAGQGEEAVELVRSHQEKGLPIQAVFLDIRMPPGIDGLETAKRLRKIDPGLQIVIVTAFSDYPFYEIASQLGRREALYYLEKPFTAEQIRQLAHSLVQQWSIRHELSLTIDRFLRLAEKRAGDRISRGEIAEGLGETLQMVEDLIGAKSLALVRRMPHGRFEHIAGTGLLESQRDIDRAHRNRVSIELVSIETEGLEEAGSALGKDDANWAMMMIEPAQSRDLYRATARAFLPYLPHVAGAMAAPADHEIILPESEVAGEREATGRLTDFHGILSADPAMLGLFDQIRRVAGQEVPIFITGETGSGKEMVARALHMEGPRSKKPFVSLNCAHLTEQLLESQLFGHRKGAFTGAVADQRGLLAEADGGTLFLDEVVEIQFTLQAKLLRVLQEREYTPLGTTRPISFDTQIISASQTPLHTAVKAGQFRPDLLYRLQVIPLLLPPLRGRGDDPSLLFMRFLRQAYKAQRGNVAFPEVSPEVRRIIRHYKWPGNVRELQNVCAYVAAMTAGATIIVENLPEELKMSLLSQIQDGLDAGNPPGAEPPPLQEGIGRSQDSRGGRLKAATSDEARDLIQNALNKSGGNRSEAAEQLGVSRMTLWRRMRALGIEQPGIG